MLIRIIETCYLKEKALNQLMQEVYFYAGDGAWKGNSYYLVFKKNFNFCVHYPERPLKKRIHNSNKKMIEELDSMRLVLLTTERPLYPLSTVKS